MGQIYSVSKDIECFCRSNFTKTSCPGILKGGYKFSNTSVAITGC